MARGFSIIEASQLCRRYQRVKKEIADLDKKAESGRKAAQDAVRLLLSEQSADALNEIPVEDLNKDRKGIRVSALKNAGYHTVGSLTGLSVDRIRSISGIGYDSAKLICERVQEYSRSAASHRKVRLSSDSRTPAATKLVTALSSYIRYEDARTNARKLLETHGDDVESAYEGLKAGTGIFRWLFASAQKKTDAETAFYRLKNHFDGAFGSEISGILREAGNAQGDAWEAFKKDPIRFNSRLQVIAPEAFGNGDEKYNLSGELASSVQDQALSTDGLLCDLRPYQTWGVKYILRQGKALLGDEMGLGKTIQAIAAMVSLKNDGEKHFLVICPVSVLTNWEREVEKHSTLSPIVIYGGGWEKAFDLWLEQGGVGVTTYTTVEKLYFPLGFKSSLIVVDEAHYIKNEAAKRSRNVRRLCACSKRLLFMTGTALENKVDEMISLISVLDPLVASRIDGKTYLAAAPEFRDLIAPVYYRRKRADVLTELPEMIASDEWCRMGPVEEQIYEANVLARRFADARRVSWNAGDLSHSCKANRMKELIGEAERDGRKVLVFSFFLDTLKAVREMLGDRCLQTINGSIPPQRRQEIIDEFEKAPAGCVLPAQIDTAGTGLNIQAASVVIICEPQFKPSTENQAIARAYRMGQTRNVLVYRLLCADSIDERLKKKLDEKQLLFDEFADRSIASEREIHLTDSEFSAFIQEEIDRIKAKLAG